MKKSKLYTKAGDSGTSTLLGGHRVPKNHIRMEALGALDELNASLGLLWCELHRAEEKLQIEKIQDMLFLVGSYIADDRSDVSVAHDVLSEFIAMLEGWIDVWDDRLPSMQGFVMPRGTRSAAQSHFCRAVCRRAERAIHTVAQHDWVDPLVSAMMNRLSDYLFVLARMQNFMSGEKEFFWQKCW